MSGAGIEAQAPAPVMKGPDQIKNLFGAARGFGYGAFGLMRLETSVTAAELEALKPAEREALRGILNDGLPDTDFNYLDKAAFCARLVEHWHDESFRDYLT